MEVEVFFLFVGIRPVREGEISAAFMFRVVETGRAIVMLIAGAGPIIGVLGVRF